MYRSYVGSQPIYNRDLSIYAYQLLFRNSVENRASFTDSDKATSEVIINTLTDIGIDKLAGTHKACINFTRNFIVGEYPIPSIKQRIIIDLDASIVPDQQLVEALNQLSIKGFTLAMPYATYQQHFSTNKEARYIIKFNTMEISPEDIAEQIENLNRDNCKVLAEKIETHAIYERCEELGCDYFQGYFICEPNIIKGSSIPANKMQLIKILNKLQDDNTDAKELDKLISADANLTYRLLRYANSSHLGLNTRIDSIQHAVSLLGWDTIKMLTTLLVLASIDDKPPSLFYFGLLRARLCETVAQTMSGIDKNTAFTAGLLSILDALLDSAMDDVLAKLPLNNELTSALLTHDGQLGKLLHDVIATVELDTSAKLRSGIDKKRLSEDYLKALIWTNISMPMLLG